MSLQGRGSLQASAPTRPPTQSASLWCVVRASLVMCSLRFSKTRDLVTRLTAPPSSALHLRVGEGSSRVPPLLALSLPRAQCSLPVTLRKDSWGPERDQGTAGTCPQRRVCQASQASPPEAWGSCPSPAHSPAPRKPLEASTHSSFGVPWSAQRPWGLPCPQMCLRPPYPCAASLRSFQKF